MRLLLSFTICVSAWSQTKAIRHQFEPDGFLTEAVADAPSAVADRFLHSSAKAVGLNREALAAAYIYREYKTTHNGVTHITYRQRFAGLDVFDSYYNVNIDRSGRVINAGGQLAGEPAAGLQADTASASPSLRAGLNALRPGRGDYGRMLLGKTRDGKGYRFARGPAAEDEMTGAPGWVVVNGKTRPAWQFYVPGEDGEDRYQVTVESVTLEPVAKRSLTMHQKARVFTGSSPTPNPKPGVLSAEGYPYVNRVEVELKGDPPASPVGWVRGGATTGNNTITGHNPLGLGLPATGTPTLANADGNFFFPLEIGPGQGAPTPYKDAITTNLFYWVNRAHDLFYASGFDEAAGNYQLENFGRGGISGDALIANSHFGTLRASSAFLNNANYTAFTLDDGSPAAINMYVSVDRDTGLFADGSLDAEVIVHEYAHGVSLRLVRNPNGFQMGAMGEAWSDFFGLEFTLPEGAPADGAYAMGEYFSQVPGTGIRTRPYSTRMDVNPLTFAQLGRVSVTPAVHADGGIWVQALWEMRAGLMAQFGEREGRRRTRLLVIDGMKLSPPDPSMLDMRDAILLADRVGFKGESQDGIWAAFAKRGMGALAQSSSSETVHIAASFEKPSNKGLVGFYEGVYRLGEPVRVVVADLNNTAPQTVVQLTSASGDLETLTLTRQGSVFVGSITTTGGAAAATPGNVRLELIPHDSITVFYNDQNTGSGTEQMQATVPAEADYLFSVGGNPIPTGSGAETPLFAAATTRRANGSTLVTLPFAFPFYGEKHRQVWVSGDGILSFERPNSLPCKDPSSLSLLTAIAPLWMELAYQSSAQREDNVFFSRGPGSITFRWAAQTQRFPSPLGQPAEPVNVTATLFEDGRVMLQYGEGNKNLVGDPFFADALGCTTTTPTIGISPGHDSLRLLSGTLSGRTNLERAPMLLAIPPFDSSSTPEVRIESPASGATAQGTLRLSGLAMDSGEIITRLDILVDGTAKARTAVNTPRPDVCAMMPHRSCPNIGFTTTLDLAGLNIRPGAHTVRVRVTNARGGWAETPEVPFATEAGAGVAPQGAIESPAAGTEAAFPLTVRGWIHAGSVRVVAVDLVVDGVVVTPLPYGAPRADVCGGITPTPVNCPAIGFQAMLTAQQLAVPLEAGRHTMQMRVRDESGRVTLVPETPQVFTLTTPTNREPVGVLETPKPNETLTGMVRIAGYAYDPDGRILAAQVIINGLVAQNLPYGMPRPEVCAALTEATACPNIGFEGVLDTRRFRNGVYSLGVRVVDDRGAVRVIPVLGANGMNIVIQN